MPLSGHSVGTLSGNELTCNSSGNTQSQSSQLAEPLWTNPGVKRGISMRKLISNKKKKEKKRRRGMNCRTVSQGSSHARKKPPRVLISVRWSVNMIVYGRVGECVHECFGVGAVK